MKHELNETRKDQFERLWARLQSAERDIQNQAAWPFVAVAGPSYSDIQNAPRLMFLGKATHQGYGSEEGTGRPSFEGQEEKAREILKAGLGSAWWGFIDEIVTAVFAGEGSLAKEVAKNPRNFIVWNNLMKVGTKSGNPEGTHAKWQAELAKECLKTELKYFDPTHVIIPTSHYQTSLIGEIFGPDVDWAQWTEIPRPHLLVREFCGRHLIWCMHPQGKSSCLLEMWKDAIISRIKATFPA
ncbi:MAG TPA: hypothetical protein PL096_11710 [Micropepsaceae bacterium]|nr:hypothetical protein [Micropepsaceae bacterium]